MSFNKGLVWQQTVTTILPSFTGLDQKELSSLITYARQAGIGKPLSYQKTIYSKDDLQKLKVLLLWWDFLNKESIPEFRDRKTGVLIQKIVIQSLINKKPISFYAIFCPSYKKGKGTYGYTGKIGSHTKSYIGKFADFVLKSTKLGVGVEGMAYFSDLLLENYQKLKGTDYKKDLMSNFLDFKREFDLKSQGKIRVELLSSLPELKKDIDEEGITTGDIKIPLDVYKIVLERNKVFYLDNLGWSEAMVKERTDVLARCYGRMGLLFRRLFPGGIMFWVESAYERGRMYSGLAQDDPVPIIYPKKDE